MLIALLLVLVTIDWATGWAAAWLRGELRSRTGFLGILRKVAMFTVVAIAHLIDTVLGDLHIFRDAVVFFYLANELLSVIENMGKIGVPMPDFLRNAVQIFQSKSNPTENVQLISKEQPELIKSEKEREESSESAPPDNRSA
ncbi:phage holin family protein [Saccharibacillus sp. JS10]|nr:phage holin family protein [Saccharibacillus sp. JS10]